MLRLAASAVLLAAVSAPADEPKPGQVKLFNDTNLMGWKAKDPAKSRWVVGGFKMNADKPAELAPVAAADTTATRVLANVVGGGTDLFTEKTFGDGTYEVEFMVPKGSNSGIYLMGEYEVQVLDSYGKPDDKLGQGDLGALYSAAAPKTNAAKKPGEWQTFVIEFQAPKFDADKKKTANAKFVKVTLNGVVLHENVEMKGPTPGGLTGKEASKGPLLFQGDHGPVAFRNVKITPAK